VLDPVRSTNARAIALYEKLGFVEEGRFRLRLRLDDGTFVDDIGMAWFPIKIPVLNAHNEPDL
jgi:RimJ/RimL family protein N-acetyltransferase